ncbi:hypothetical protein HDU96_007249, partial [Phlyctochytrium bullatum]
MLCARSQGEPRFRQRLYRSYRLSSTKLSRSFANALKFSTGEKVQAMFYIASAASVMVTLYDAPGFISEQALSTMSVLPACDHNLFMSLGPTPTKTPEPVPLSPRHRMNQVVAIVADIARIVPVFDQHRSNLADLGGRRLEMLAMEGALKQVLAELPEGVGEEPSKEF